MNEIIFRNESHKNMYDGLIKRCRRVDNETVPVMYLSIKLRFNIK